MVRSEWTGYLVSFTRRFAVLQHVFFCEPEASCRGTHRYLTHCMQGPRKQQAGGEASASMVYDANDWEDVCAHDPFEFFRTFSMSAEKHAGW